ncbi:MAG: shikimate kinase [Proteobacteria bacterium]|jgi:shikimate kinase|nr:shikimate kinase [Pseudomonadota bacterium]
MRNIVLIGPMGAGKTTVGKQLAEHFSLDFVDADAALEDRLGVSILTIFDIEGEDGFRKRENTILHELCERKNIVLATGGGAILMEDNRILLRRAGTVVYLDASIDAQVKRTRNRRDRPLLNDVDDPRAALEALMEIRAPLYRQEADITVMSGERSVTHVTREIIAKLDES